MQSTSILESNLFIALVAALAAIIGASVSSLTNFIIGRTSAKLERDRVLVDYLMGKISALELARNEVSDETNALVSTDPQNVDLQEIVVRGVLGFRRVDSILQRVSHYLNEASFDELNRESELLKESQAFHNVRDQGSIKSREDWKGRKDEILIDSEFLAAVSEFPNHVAQALEGELRRSAMAVEKRIGL